MYTAGLALEGGGMRGVFTAGVLDFFMDNGVKFEEVWGVSAGACHACSYISGQRGRAFAVSTDYLGDKRYLSFRSLVTTGDIFGAELTYDIVPNKLNPYDYDAFIGSGSRLVVVVTNCVTGAAEYREIRDLRSDMIWVRASSSLPMVSRMVEIEGRKYLDGGVADSIPVAEMRRRGIKKIVAVLTQPSDYRKKPAKMLPYELRYADYPLLRRAVRDRYRMYNAEVSKIAALEKNGDAFVIRPEKALGLSRFEKDVDRLRGAYDEGYSAAAKRYGAMQSYLAAK